jgi:HD-GYP domain-containing protein (c-di-GMP phosphodiesterase class II)
MSQYNYPRVNDIDSLWRYIKESSLASNLEKIDLISETHLAVFTFNDLLPLENTLLDQLYASFQQKSLKEYVEKAVIDSINFGQNLLVEFGAENTLLGIVQSGELGRVINILQPIHAAISSGALSAAIEMAKSMPEENFDETFITPERILSCVNKMEAYLGLPLSEEL